MIHLHVVAVTRSASMRLSPTVRVARCEEARVSRTSLPPMWVLHVVAMTIEGSIFVRWTRELELHRAIAFQEGTANVDERQFVRDRLSVECIAAERSSLGSPHLNAFLHEIRKAAKGNTFTWKPGALLLLQRQRLFWRYYGSRGLHLDSRPGATQGFRS